MKNLVESSSGGARAQLSMALSRMVARRDCEHEYANNRAKEMVQELAKDDSTLSNELRYLQPLVYKYWRHQKIQFFCWIKGFCSGPLLYWDWYFIYFFSMIGHSNAN